MKPRTRARLALQVLYEVDMANHPPGEVFKTRPEEFPLTEELTEFARQIIFGILPLTQELDQLIAKYAPDWPLDQIAAIDRNICVCRCGNSRSRAKPRSRPSRMPSTSAESRFP